jgi:3-methyladenine DNA glycosylase/8-oxoguanine DNA glycosylase
VIPSLTESHGATVEETQQGLPSQKPDGLVAALAHLRAADPALARVIDENPAFDPGAWNRRWPTLDLFGALVLQVVGPQISVSAAKAVFMHLLDRLGGRVLDPDELAAVDPEVLRGLGLSARKHARCTSSQKGFEMAASLTASYAAYPMRTR